MTTSAGGYKWVQEWVKAMLGRTHATGGRTIAWGVLCVLVAQRVTPAALARPPSGAGRARAGSAAPGAARVDGPSVGPSRRASPADPSGPGAAAARAAHRGGPRHDPAGAMGGLARRDRRGGPPAAHRLGRHPLPVAHRPLPHHDPGHHPAAPGRLPGWGALDPCRGPRLAACAPLRPTPSREYRLQRAAALEGWGDGGGRLGDRRCALGGVTVGGWAAGGPTSHWCRAGSS
jgi:hypothetical protein